MSQKKESILLLASVAICGCFLVAGGWLWTRLTEQREQTPSLSQSQSERSPAPSPPGSSVQERISFGEKILVKKEELSTENSDFREAKQRGVSAMAAGNYEEAASNFEEATGKYRNAPETLIYLNNARIGNSKSYAIAVGVPTAIDPDLALAVLRGVAQAQDEINRAGGINGVPLKVAIANDDNAPEAARKIASALVANSEVLGVVGHISSGVTLAAGEAYNSGKLVAISAISTSVELSGKYDWVFRTIPSDAFTAKKLSEAMRNQLKKQKAAIFFNSDSPYSQSLKSEFVEEVFLNGGEIVAEFDLSDPSLSARQSLEEATRQGAQVLMLAPSLNALDKALQVVTTNRKQLSLLGGDTLYTFKTLDIGVDLAVGMLVAVPWQIEGDLSSDFPSRSRQLWSADVNWMTAMAYDATRAFIAALEQSPTRTGIRDALLSPDFSATGATGKIRFLPSGDRNGPVQLVEIREANPSRSGTGYDFVPIQ
ncbi:MAG: ABC transporter substrate-binding protein [Oscillatoria sp. SIO1A7]|nr:ABC transporter substrate-binding protein [Oscillatoria sp. SIO1A7]